MSTDPDSVGEWLQTLPLDLPDDQPKETIRPTLFGTSTAGERLEQALSELRAAPLGGGLDLGGTLGEGGMGRVRAGVQRALGRQVAVKELKAQGAPAVLKLLQEAWIAGSLEHPAVVPVHDLVLDAAGLPRMVMKRVEGVDWSVLLANPQRVVARGASDVRAWHLRVLLQVANAVELAHSRGIVHRDLKPDNVRIGSFGEVYLLDWGLAVSLVDDGSGRLPLAADVDEIAGTPAYIAPEMVRMGPITARTDVYLLGACLYHVLVGHPPHDAPSLRDALRSAASADPPVPHHLPGELVGLLRDAMALDPAARIADVATFRQRLSGWLEHAASVDLAEEAAARFEIVAAEIEKDAPDRDVIATHLAAARFGWAAALRTWPDNPVARVGRRRALARMIEFDLGRGEIGAAEALLADVDDPPESLVEQVRGARAEVTARRAHIAALARDADVELGMRTRLFFAVVVSVVFVVFPLGLWAWLDRDLDAYGYAHAFAWNVVVLALVVGLTVWARASLAATRLNRLFAASMVLLPCAQTLLDLGGLVGGVPMSTVVVVHPFLWAVMCGWGFVVFHRALLVPTAVYGAVWIAVAHEPSWMWPLAAFGNLVFGLTLAVLWSGSMSSGYVPFEGD